MFNQDRNQMREVFFEAYQKWQSQGSLTPLEQQLVALFTWHPEYSGVFSDPEENLDREYAERFGESNPFLHLSMHLAIREQIATDRPAGIQAIYYRLCQADPEKAHDIEHLMMDCLRQHLAKGNEKLYLEDLMRLTPNHA